MEAECSVRERLRLAGRSPDKEDGHLPHEEAAAYALEGVVGHKVHGVVQPALLVVLWHLQPLDVAKQSPLLHRVGEPDLGDDFVVVEGQGDAGSSWTVALRNGDVSDETHDRVTHVVEGGATGVLRDVQGERQLGGVQRALLLT